MCKELAVHPVHRKTKFIYEGAIIFINYIYTNIINYIYTNKIFGFMAIFGVTLLEIYFNGDKCRNFDDFCQIAPKYVSAENNLRRIFISAEYLSPPNIYLRENYLTKNTF